MDRTQNDLLDFRICSQCAADPAAVAQTVCPHSPLLTDDPLLGTTIAQRYQVLSVIGMGGWSTVYKAEDTKLKRFVALKILHAHLCMDQEKLQRFQREAQSASSINNLNVGTIYDTGMLPAGRPYIVMELVEGKSLAEVIAQRKPLPELIDIFKQICRGLDAIHKYTIVHRDLKPSNIIISEAGIVKLLDFGSAKWILANERLTKTDEAIGTPSYMSPEQFWGRKVDARSDIYSLGCIMYEAVSSTKAFPGDRSLLCMQLQMQSLPPALKQVSTEAVPARLEQIIFKALAKNPNDRFENVDQLLAALEGYNSPPSFVQNALHLVSLQKSKIRPWMVATGSLLLLVVGFTTWLFVAPQLEPKRILSFPEGHSVGALYEIKNLGQPGEARVRIGDAQGQVIVAADTPIALNQIPKKDAVTLSFVDSLKPDDLYSVDLYDGAITADSVKQLNKLSGLKVLSFSRSDVTDETISYLYIPNLKGLDLNETKLTDVGVHHIVEAMPKLKWISLMSTPYVTNSGVSELAKLTQVDALRLAEMPKVTGECVAALSKSPTLSFLEMTSDKVDNQQLQPLTNAPSLHALDLANTSVTDDGVATLAQCVHLRNLNLNEDKVTDACIPSLLKIKTLRHLHLSDTQITKPGLEKLKSGLPECTFD